MDPRVLFAASALSLAVLARRAQARGLTRHEFFVVCIAAECAAWAGLIEELMAGTEWYADRTCGERPTIRGTVLRTTFVDKLVRAAPGLSRALRSRPSPGTVHAVSLGERTGEPCASMYALMSIAEAA
jgi:hypothetical protein